jgi:hypothetical protein
MRPILTQFGCLLFVASLAAQDVIRPTVASFTASPGQIQIVFDDAGGMNAETVTDRTRYTLLLSGGDGQFGNDNDIDHSADLLTVTFDAPSLTATLNLNDLPLEDDTVRLLIGSVTDLAGNAVVDDGTLIFHAHDARQNPRVWRAGVTGDWETAANWHGNAVPSDNTDILIIDSTVTVTLTSTVAPTSLSCEGAFTIGSSGHLTVMAASAVTQSFVMQAGATLTVVGATFTANGAAEIQGAHINGINGGSVAIDHAVSADDLICSMAGGGTLSLAGITQFDRCQLSVSGGSHFILPATVTSYSSSRGMGINEKAVLFSADGLGSRLDLSALASIEAVFSGLGAIAQIVQATNHGVVDLSGLGSMTGGGRGANGGGRLQLKASSAGEILLPDLASLDGQHTGIEFAVDADWSLPKLTSVTNTRLLPTANRSLSLPLLTTFADGYIPLPSGATIQAPLLNTFTTSTLELDASATFDAPSLTTIDGSYIRVTNGASYTLPDAVTSYDATGSIGIGAQIAAFSAAGSGSVLDLSALQSMVINFSGLGALQVRIEATDGGTVDLASVTSISGGGSGANGGGPLVLEGRTGTLLLSSLSDLIGINAGIDLALGDTELANLQTLANVDFEIPAGSRLELPSLTTIEGAAIAIADASVFSVPQVTAFSHCAIDFDGSAAIEHGALSSIDGCRIHLTNGAAYQLPATVSTFRSTTSQEIGEKLAVFTATGSGSYLDLSALQNCEFVFAGLGPLRQSVEASDGGIVDLSGVATISGGGSGANGGGPLRFFSETGGHIDLSQATAITGIHAGIEFMAESLSLGDTTLSHVDFHLSTQASVSAGDLLFEQTCDLVGSGTITANLSCDGRIAPDHTQALTVTGNLVLTANAMLDIDLSGLQADQYDQIHVAGIATLGGRLTLTIDAGLPETEDDVFELLTATERRSTFADYQLFGSPAFELHPAYGADHVRALARPLAAPTVLSLSPTGLVDFVPGVVTVTFSEFVNPATFSVVDVTIDGPMGPVIPNAVRPLSATQFDIELPFLPALGQYTLSLAPTMTDAAGTALDQDGDGTAGENPDDRVERALEVVMPNLAAALSAFPATAAFGDSIDLTWQVESTGNAPASGEWEDRVWLSTDATLSIDDRLLHRERQFRSLAVNTSYSVQITPTLPLDATLLAGEYVLIVEVNADADLPEYTRVENSPASPTLAISYDSQFPLQLSAGWNLVGMPIAPDLTTPEDLFRDQHDALVFRGQILGLTAGELRIIDDLAVQDAFWIFCDRAAMVTVVGTRVLRNQVEFGLGWTGHASLNNEDLSALEAVTTLWWWDASKGHFRIHAADEALTQGRGYLFDSPVPQTVEFDVSEQ